MNTNLNFPEKSAKLESNVWFKSIEETIAFVKRESRTMVTFILTVQILWNGSLFENFSFVVVANSTIVAIRISLHLFNRLSHKWLREKKKQISI